MPSLRGALRRYREDGAVALSRRAREYAGRTLIDRMAGPRPDGSVVDEDWDTLVVLDACRYDVFEQVSELPGNLERRTSRGSVTWEFLRENFEGRQLHDTIYVAGNAVVADTSDALDTFKLVGLWEGRESPDGHPEVVHPETVVEAALDQLDAHPDKRLVVHFLQPHEPFLWKDGEPLDPESKYRDFQAARAGDVTAAEVRSVYEENLEYVLSHVGDLLERLDGRTVVTADHGELLGEGIPTMYRILHPRWPIRKRHHFDYGHYSRVRVPELVEVPWLVVEGDRRREVTASDPVDSESVPEATVEHLEALGYRT